MTKPKSTQPAWPRTGGSFQRTESGAIEKREPASPGRPAPKAKPRKEDKS